MARLGMIFVAGVTVLLTLTATPPSHAEHPPLSCYVCGGSTLLNFASEPKSRKFQFENHASEASKTYDIAVDTPCEGTKGALVDCSKLVPSKPNTKTFTITLFEGENGQGRIETVTFGDGQCVNIPNFNDKPSSVSNPTRDCFKLWEDENCGGKSVTLFIGSDSLKSLEFDKKASAVSDCILDRLGCVEVRTKDGDIGRDCASSLTGDEKSKMTAEGSEIKHCFANSCNFNIPDDSSLIQNRQGTSKGSHSSNSTRSCRAGWQLSVVPGLVLLTFSRHF